MVPDENDGATAVGICGIVDPMGETDKGMPVVGAANDAVETPHVEQPLVADRGVAAKEVVASAGTPQDCVTPQVGANCTVVAIGAATTVGRCTMRND